MSVDERIRVCKLIELINKHPDFAKEVGLSYEVTFINNKNGVVTVKKEPDGEVF